jgi:hypothetical protein
MEICFASFHCVWRKSASHLSVVLETAQALFAPLTVGLAREAE